MIAALRARFGDHPQLHIHPGDVLDIDLAQWGPASLAGNLPYYITSPILDRIRAARHAIRRATLLMQKEVAQRLTARHGTRDYGYLTVRTRIWASVEPVIDVPPGAFRPPPKVDSAVVQLVPLEQTPPDMEAFLAFAERAFRQKRKTLRNNLSAEYPGADWETLPERGLRAEQLDLESLRVLWGKLS